MPRDCTPHAAGEVALPAGRTGRVVELIAAGQFAVAVVGADVISRLAGAGVLSRDEVEAAQVVALLWEMSGLRPHVAGSYDPCFVDNSSDGDGPFERMTAAETRAWRRLNRLLAAAPPQCRAEIERVCLWDQRPTSIPALRLGLRALAAALGQRRDVPWT